MKNKALFLDRDGVINKDNGYTYRIEDFIFINGIFDLCKKAILRDYFIIVITNQSGISRELYTEKDFHIVTEYMLKEFEKKQIKISKVYYCPYHNEFPNPKYNHLKNYRKPNPGMIIDAEKEFDLSLKDSILVGDKLSDIQAGINSGIKNNFLFSNNHNEKENSQYKVVRDFSEKSLSLLFS